MTRWRALVALLDRREPALALAVYRILMGLNLLWAIVSVWGAGLVEVLWLEPDHGGIRPLPDDGSWLIGMLGGPTPEVVWPLVYGTTAAAILLTLGVGARIMAFLGLQGFMALAWINGHAGGSYDTLMTNALWLVVLADSGATLSLTARLRTGRWRTGAQVTAWPRWLVVAQLLIMYCSTGLQKVSASWVPGGDHSALYYILQQPSWKRFDMRWAAWVYPGTQLASLSVWLFEVGAPLLGVALWFRHTRARPGRLRAWSNRLDARSLFAIYGLLMHVGIHSLMAVGPFSLICAAMYACLFSGDEWRAGFSRLAGAAGGSRSTPAAPSPPSG